MRGISVWCAIAVVAAGVAVAGCGGDETRGPTLKVMSWNVFIGADVSRLFPVSTAAELGDAASELFADVEANDFRDRAMAIAAVVVAEQPDLVGLQEVALWRTQTPADGSVTPASDVAFDFAEILLAALEEQGGDYAVVASVEGVDGEVPTPDGDIRFTDRDVVLARRGAVARLDVTGSAGGRFATNFSADSPVGEVTIARGWASVEIVLEGRAARFVTTHLEVIPFGGIQLAQAEELAAGARSAEAPTILAGDINSPADGSGTDTYDRLLAAGFMDAWVMARGDAPGFTCCREPDLRDDRALDKRIDLALLFGEFEVVSADVVGDTPEARSPGGRWPSDHAGVVVTLRLP